MTGPGGVVGDDRAAGADHPAGGDVDEQLHLASERLGSGDRSSAVHHLLAALWLDPAPPSAQALLDRLADEAGPQAADHVPDRHEWTSPEAAARAWLLLATGQTPSGMSLLLDVVTGDLARPWGAWLALWSERLGADVAVDPAALVRACRRLLADPLTREGVDLHPSASLACREVVALVDRTLPEAPTDARLRAMGSAVARRSGRADLATAWAAEAERLEPVYWTTTMAAYALREARRIDAAVAAFRRAAAAEPHDLDIRVDAAATLARADRIDEALVWLDEVLAADPDHPVARAMATDLRHRP